MIERIGDELRSAGREPTADDLPAAAAPTSTSARWRRRSSRASACRADAAADADAPDRGDRDGDGQPLGRVHTTSGAPRAWSEGNLAALFAGPPGTGKTMASEAIAREPGCRWCASSQVVNKYIGGDREEPKRLFDAADAADTILFFDEADALFGKRTEVRTRTTATPTSRSATCSGGGGASGPRSSQPTGARTRQGRFHAGCACRRVSICPASRALRIWRAAWFRRASTRPSSTSTSSRGASCWPAATSARSCSTPACRAPARTRAAADDSRSRAVQREYAKLERASGLDQFGPYAPLVAATRCHDEPQPAPRDPHRSPGPRPARASRRRAAEDRSACSARRSPRRSRQARSRRARSVRSMPVPSRRPTTGRRSRRASRTASPRTRPRSDDDAARRPHRIRHGP